MISDRKKKLYEEFQTRNNLDLSIDNANAFIVAMVTGTLIHVTTPIVPMNLIL